MAKTKSSLLIILILVITDIVAVNMAFLFVYWLRFDSGLIPLTWAPPDIRDYTHLLAFVSLVLVLILRSQGLYATRKRLSTLDEYFYLVRAVTLSMFFLMALTFLYREFSYSRVLIIFSWASAILFLSVSRFFVDKFELWYSKARGAQRRILIIGTRAVARRMAEVIKNTSRATVKMMGFLSLGHETSEPEMRGMTVLGTLDDLPSVIKEKKADEVILTEPGLPHKKIIDVILQCEKEMVSFRMVPDLMEMMTSQLTTHTFSGITLLGLREPPLDETYNRLTKRAVDLAGSALGLLFLLPLFLAVAVIVKRDSPGPVFYRQKRVGEDGRHFTIYKFRTMKFGAEDKTGPVWAKEDDPRRTKIGAFLRRYNIDELPQLFNVLKGEMSLVGPRPERPEFVGKFKEDIPRYMSRHKIKSGITGWAQVNGLRGETSIEERTKYDLYYIENWSIWLDLKILAMSLFATKNAY